MAKMTNQDIQELVLFQAHSDHSLQQKIGAIKLMIHLMDSTLDGVVVAMIYRTSKGICFRLGGSSKKQVEDIISKEPFNHFIHHTDLRISLDMWNEVIYMTERGEYSVQEIWT